MNFRFLFFMGLVQDANVFWEIAINSLASRLLSSLIAENSQGRSQKNSFSASWMERGPPI